MDRPVVPRYLSVARTRASFPKPPISGSFPQSIQSDICRMASHNRTPRLELEWAPVTLALRPDAGPESCCCCSNCVLPPGTSDGPAAVSDSDPWLGIKEAGRRDRGKRTDRRNERKKRPATSLAHLRTTKQRFISVQEKEGMKENGDPVHQQRGNEEEGGWL